MNIVIKRGAVVSFADLPNYSICVDGFVAGPAIDSENHKFSFDHHAGCIRFCTTSACMQAMDAVRLGLDPEPYTVYANDVDSDVCAAIWCLKNPSRCKEPLAEKLINAIGKGDMFAGAIDMNGMKRAVEFICSPQTSSVRSGDYEKLSDEGLMSILESMLHRIDLYVNGEASIEIAKQQCHDEYKVLRQENNWALIESTDTHILGKLWGSNFERVAVIRPLADGSTAVTLAKKSDFIDGFPLIKIYEALNAVESGWGGSSCCGGAPRNENGERSKLSVKQITDIIDSVILAPALSSAEKRSSRPPKTKKKSVE